MVTSWTVFAINPNVPAKTLPELITYAKANPGKLRYGSGGVGGVLHIAVEMLKLATGTDIVHVPYRSGAQAATDTISGQIDMVSMGLASARVAEGGKLRVLAQTGPSRHPMFAEVPTTAERGPARRAHGDLVRLDRAAQHAGSRSSRASSARSTTVARQRALGGQAGQDRLRGGLHAAIRVRRASSARKARSGNV